MDQRNHRLPFLSVFTLSLVLAGCASPPAEKAPPGATAAPERAVTTPAPEPKEEAIVAEPAPEPEPMKMEPEPAPEPKVVAPEPVAPPPPPAAKPAAQPAPAPVAKPEPTPVKAKVPSDPNTFIVNVQPKNGTHPYKGYGADHGFAVNGEPGKILVLERGQTYTFEVDTGVAHDFYFTTSSRGWGAGTYTDGIEGQFTYKGTVTFKPTSTTPDVLYYECRNHKYMGGKIYIVDKGQKAKIDPTPDIDPADKVRQRSFALDERQVKQKLAYAKLLAMSGSSAKTIREGDNAEAKQILNDATQMLSDAEKTLGGGDLEGAMAKVDEALRQINAAAQLAGGGGAPAVDYKAEYERIHKENVGYKASYDKNAKSGAGSKLGVKFDEAHYSDLMKQAESLAAKGDHEAAMKPLHEASKMITGAISVMLDDSTVVFDINFASPKEEYEYELARYESYHELVPLAIEQKQPNERQQQLMQEFVTKADRIVGEGKEIAGRGDYKTAIQALEAATDNIKRALMIVGVR